MKRLQQNMPVVMKYVRRGMLIGGSLLIGIVIVSLMFSISTPTMAAGGKHTPQPPAATQQSNPKPEATQQNPGHSSTPTGSNCPGKSCNPLPTVAEACEGPAAIHNPHCFPQSGPTATPGTGPTATPGTGPTATPGTGPTVTATPVPNSSVTPTVTVPNTITKTVGVDHKEFHELMSCCSITHDLLNTSSESTVMTVTIAMVDKIGSFPAKDSKLYTLTDTADAGKWMRTDHKICEIAGLKYDGVLYVQVWAQTKSGATWLFLDEWLVYHTDVPCSCSSK